MKISINYAVKRQLDISVVKLVAGYSLSLLDFYNALLVLQTCINPFRISKQLNQSWEQHKWSKSTLMATQKSPLLVPFVLVMKTHWFWTNGWEESQGEPTNEEKAKQSKNLIWIFAVKRSKKIIKNIYFIGYFKKHFKWDDHYWLTTECYWYRPRSMEAAVEAVEAEVAWNCVPPWLHVAKI